NALEIRAISEPAINMLQQILTALPLIFTAGLILVIAYVVGKFVADLVTNILTSIGFDNIFTWLGIRDASETSIPPTNVQPTRYEVPPISTPGIEPATNVQPTRYEVPPISTPGIEPVTPQGGATTSFDTAAVAARTPSEVAVQPRSPSEVVGIVALVGIMLFAALQATEVLGFEALTAVVLGLIAILGRILFGLVVFAVGLYFANLAFRLILSSGTHQANILAQTARIAIIVFVSALALQQIGIASSIVNLAFGLLLGAIAVAVALAFGLGSMDIAAEQVREWLTSFKRRV
ncbi:MAG TPA: mechanosensitive ion channel, partial [Candidatus Caenarcaniphilales bacterium]